MRTFVYIDGFNLYYGAVKGTPYKWLDLSRLCSNLLRPENRVLRIKYFTAKITGRSDDPNRPTRQQIYLRALRTIPNLEIVYGHYLSHEVSMPLAGCPPGQQKFAKVIKTEEKGSDVNLATHLVNDAHKGEFDVAVLVTNDSDLRAAVHIVRNELGLVVGVLNPHQKQSVVLAREASFVKSIRRQALRKSQFPAVLSDKQGSFHKPPSW